MLCIVQSVCVSEHGPAGLQASLQGAAACFISHGRTTASKPLEMIRRRVSSRQTSPTGPKRLQTVPTAVQASERRSVRSVRSVGALSGCKARGSEDDCCRSASRCGSAEQAWSSNAIEIMGSTQSGLDGRRFGCREDAQRRGFGCRERRSAAASSSRRTQYRRRHRSTRGACHCRSCHRRFRISSQADE